jgi:amidase
MFVDTVGAFCPHGRFELAGSGGGALAGRTFAVKDLFDIAGHVTGAGNPAWLATHPAAAATAPAVEALLAAGGRMIGKTITDELAYSLNGDNIHYGTPRNTRAPDRVPGGSSSGSAAAVAAGLADFALGTDTGGSVRIPASYCGVFGIRTTQGAISTAGLVPLMPSFDTVGWFARDPALFATVGTVLLPAQATPDVPPRRLMIAADAFAIADPSAAESFRSGIDALRAAFDDVQTVALADDDDMVAWRSVFRTLSAYESWRTHGAWIEAHAPKLSSPIAERFAYAKSVGDADVQAARRTRDVLRARVLGLVAPDCVLCLPSAPGPAPKLRASGDEVEAFRQRAQRLTSVSVLSGLPEVSLPGLAADGAPVGLSLIGPAGSDLALLRLAHDIAVRTNEFGSRIEAGEHRSRGAQCG